MWITRKQLNKMIENKLADQKRKYDLEISSRDREISMLKTEFALKELCCTVATFDRDLHRWSGHWA